MESRGLAPAGGRLLASGPITDGQADALTGRDLLAAGPEGMRTDGLEALPRANPRPGLSIDHRRTRLGEIGQSQLDRVEAQTLAQLVDQ